MTAGDPVLAALRCVLEVHGCGECEFCAMAEQFVDDDQPAGGGAASGVPAPAPVSAPRSPERKVASQAEPERPTPGERGVSRWSRHVAALERVVRVDGVEKALGDCTADDLAMLAAHHTRQAARHDELARRYESYARLVREQGKATLRDVFADRLERAA